MKLDVVHVGVGIVMGGLTIGGLVTGQYFMCVIAALFTIYFLASEGV